MATSLEFVAQLKKDIQAFPKIRIKHPFLKAVCNGTAVGSPGTELEFAL